MPSPGCGPAPNHLHHWSGTLLSSLLVVATLAFPPKARADEAPTSLAVEPTLPVYQWTDASGMQHFSNDPPPADVQYREISGELRAIRIRAEQPTTTEVGAGEAAASVVAGSDAKISGKEGAGDLMDAQRLSYCASLAAQINKLEQHLQDAERAEVIDRLVLTLHRYEARHRAECR